MEFSRTRVRPLRLRARPPLSYPCVPCLLPSPFPHTQGEKRVLFDAQRDGQNVAPKWVAPEDEQEPNESRRYVVPAHSHFHPTLLLRELTVVGPGQIVDTADARDRREGDGRRDGGQDGGRGGRG